MTTAQIIAAMHRGMMATCWPIIADMGLADAAASSSSAWAPWWMTSTST